MTAHGPRDAISKLRTHLINRGRVRCQRFGAAARREEGEYPSWIFDRRATQPQRQRSATLRAKLWQAAGGVAPQSQNASAMLLRRALPATRQGLAHSFPIYEMGSNAVQVQGSLFGPRYSTKSPALRCVQCL